MMMSSYYVIDSNDFRDFADLCFQSFGDRVKHWFTLNEPSIYSVHGFDSGIGAPGRCSAWVDKACQAGDSATEPYTVTHNLLRSHAAAVKLYREKYQVEQNW
jgi:beta-glucosidase